MTPTRTAARMLSISERIMASSAPSASAVAAEIRRVLAAVASGEEPVVVKDAEGVTWEIANPGDHDWTRALWAFQFGNVGTAHVLAWANGADSGLEEAADYLMDSGKPGYFVDADVMAQHYEEARADLGPEADESAVSEKAEADLTYTEAGYIPSDEWRVSEAPPELVKLAKAASSAQSGDGGEQQA